MSGYILCQLKRAKMPYYIENISTNIYSIEELCYYFYHNIYLLDETILNEHLCDKNWGWKSCTGGFIKSWRIIWEQQSLFWPCLKKLII